MDTFVQKEAQEIEAAAQRKKKRKYVVRDNESNEFQETDNENITDDYDNSISFFEIIFEYYCTQINKIFKNRFAAWNWDPKKYLVEPPLKNIDFFYLLCIHAMI